MISILMTWRILFCTLAILLLSALPLSPSQGIIIRHDKADSRYQVNPRLYPQIFFLHTIFDNRVCVATLISRRWAITAAHCTQETPLGETLAKEESFLLEIAGRSVAVDRVVLHPDHDTGDQLKNVDLALLHLDQNVLGMEPVSLYRSPDEYDRVFSLLGWGFSGIGTRGMISNDGKFRRAQNRVVEAEQWLLFLFDDPRQPNSDLLDLEGVPGLGDSGGPALLETEEGLFIAGVALGELEVGEAPPVQGLYGTFQVYERISNHLEWIDQVIADR
ncbi:MAG: S1 family peptidase [Pseudohongiellaceae bacterium]